MYVAIWPRPKLIEIFMDSSKNQTPNQVLITDTIKNLLGTKNYVQLQDVTR